jgi:hypothetical protein
MRWTWPYLVVAAFSSPIETISAVPLTLGNEAKRRHVTFLRKLQEKEAVDQSSLMRQFMSSFSRNMKKAILEDSRGDMDENERVRQLDALSAEDNHLGPARGRMPSERGDDDADRLSQGLEPRSWSHGQSGAAPRAAIEEFESDIVRGLTGPEGPPREQRGDPEESAGYPARGDREEFREPHTPSRERVGLLNGHLHHSHRAHHRAVPAAHSAAVGTALFLVAPALFL